MAVRNKSKLDYFALKVPLSIFNDHRLTKNELVVEFLKQYRNMSTSQIAQLIDRDVSTVKTLLSRALKKRKKTSSFLEFNMHEGSIPLFLFKDKELSYEQIISKYKNNITDAQPYQIPISIFKNEGTPLSNIIKYLRDIVGLKFVDIEKILGRNQKSIALNYKKSKSNKFVFDLNCIHVPLFIFADKLLSLKENLFAYLINIGEFDEEDIAEYFNINIKDVNRTLYLARKKGGEFS